jgi:hypothetical protein
MPGGRSRGDNRFGGIMAALTFFLHLFFLIERAMERAARPIGQIAALQACPSVLASPSVVTAALTLRWLAVARHVTGGPALQMQLPTQLVMAGQPSQTAPPKIRLSSLTGLTHP